MRFWPAPLDIRHLAEWRTQLIMFNYISFKFENPLKERIALAAGRCLPTHTGNRGLLCLNYVIRPWAAALGGALDLGLPAPKAQSSGSSYARPSEPHSVLANDLGPTEPQRWHTMAAEERNPAKACPRP